MEWLIDVVKRAGELALEIRSKGLETRMKEDGSPVTNADILVSRMIEEEAKMMGIPVYSEESDGKAGGEYLLVDPIDGTKEFIKGGSDFTINAAIIRNGKPVAGVIYAPARSEIWWSDGRHSWKNGKRISVSSSLKRMAASRSHSTEMEKRFAEILGLEAIRVGSSIKGCWVAEGRVDVYPRFSPTNPWDIAAMHSIIVGAGGRITDIHGNELEYHPKRKMPMFISSNGMFHDKLLEAARRVVDEVQGNH